MPEISRFCHTVSRISPSPSSRAILARPRICSAVILPTGSTTPAHTLPGWLWAMHADVRLPVLPVRRRNLVCRQPHQLAAELGLDLDQELVEPPGVEHVLEPRLLAVGAVAVVDEHAHDGVGHGHRLVGLHVDIAELGEILVSRDAADAEPEPDAGIDSGPFATVTAVKAMSLVSSSTGMAPPPSKPTLNLRGRP